MKQYSFKINGKQYDVTVGPADGKHIQVNVNGADYSVEMESADGPSASEPVQAAPVTAAPAAPETAAPAAASGLAVPTPMPGVIIELCADPTMSCNAIMRPFAIGLGVCIALVGGIDLTRRLLALLH